MTHVPHDGRKGALYLIAGGYHRRPEPHPERLLAGILAEVGIRSPRVACLGSANGDDHAFFLWGTDWFASAGAGRVELAPTASPRADPSHCRQIVTESDIIFISGGDVAVGMRVLTASGHIPLLRSLHRAGRPFIGLSAGSIMLGRHWVRWRNPDDNATAESFACLGLAPLVCDTHEEEDDWPELKSLLQIAPARTAGYGIVSGAALRVAPARDLSALGGNVQRFRKGHGEIIRLSDLQPT